MKKIDSKLELAEESAISEAAHPSAEDIKSLAALSCRFYVEDWDSTEGKGRARRFFGPVDPFWVAAQPDEIKESLVNLFMEFCNVVAQAENTVRTAEAINKLQGSAREQEMKWLDDNKELLAVLAGKWVAIEDDRLIASSEDFSIVLDESKAKGIKVPFIVFIPPPVRAATVGM